MILAEYNLVTYLIIVGTLLSFFPIGKFLGVKGLFTASLVGISLAAVPVAIFANFAAGLIHYIIPLEIFLSILLLIWICWHHGIQFKVSKHDLGLLLMLGTVTCLLFFSNNPLDVFYEQRGPETFLNFNDHYSYYSIQSIEMLNADYFSRLNVSNMFPLPWTKYHFHTSSVFAVLQYYTPIKALQSYFMAQVVVFIFVFLSFAETLFKDTQLSTARIVLFFSWVYFGLSVLFHSVGWNISTTGIISVFAFFQLLYTLINNNQNRQDLFLYGTLLGLSAIRLVPITITVYGYFFILQTEFFKMKFDYFRKSLVPALKTYLRKLYLIEKGLLVTLLLYLLSTILSSRRNPEGIHFLETGAYSDPWSYGLFIHKILNFVFGGFGLENIYRDHSDLKTFEIFTQMKVIHLGLALILFLGLLFVVIKAFKMYRPKIQSLFDSQNKLSLKNLIIIGLLLLTLKLSLITAIYISLFVTLLSLDNTANRKSTNFILAIVFAAYLFQYTGANEIKSPVLTLIFDGLIWILPLLMLINQKEKRQYLASAFVLLLILVSKPRISNHLRYPTMFELNVSNTDRASLVLAGKINSTNFLLLEDTPKKLEAISAITGSRLHYKEDFIVFRNNSFTDKSQLE